MRKYDFAKAREIIGKHAATLEKATLGMAEDWWWTGEVVWEAGTFVKDLKPGLEIAGIDGSSWATPAIKLDFKDGTTKFHPCHDGGKSEDPTKLQRLVTEGVFSGPTQNGLPQLTEAQP